MGVPVLIAFFVGVGFGLAIMYAIASMLAHTTHQVWLTRCNRYERTIEQLVKAVRDAKA